MGDALIDKKVYEGLKGVVEHITRQGMRRKKAEHCCAIAFFISFRSFFR
jgi:hypothetical protein